MASMQLGTLPVQLNEFINTPIAPFPWYICLLSIIRFKSSYYLQDLLKLKWLLLHIGIGSRNGITFILIRSSSISIPSATQSKMRTQPLLTLQTNVTIQSLWHTMENINFINGMHTYPLTPVFFSVFISDVFTQNCPVWVCPSVSTGILRLKWS